MFEAFTVAIRLSLTNGISGGLTSIISQFGRAHGQARLLKKELQGIKLTALAGAGLSATGLAGLGMIAKTLPYAKEYAHQLALMNVSGMKQAEIAKSVAAAWDTTKAIPTTTAAENLAAIRELRMVFGDTGHAITALPVVQKLQSVLADVKGVGNPKDEAYTVAKALEQKGAVRDPAQFALQADMIAKAIIASGGKVTAHDFLQNFIYGRRATYGWNDEFAYTILPTLIQEMKGSGGGARGPGNALMSAYATVVGGTVPQKSLAVWNSLGLLDRSKIVWNKQGDMKGLLPGGIVGSETFAANPFQWAQTVLLPAMQRKHMSEAQMRQELQYLFPNRTASIMDQMVLQAWKFQRDQSLIRKTSGLEAYQQLLKTDPMMAEMALQKQWQNLLAILGYSIMPTLLQATQALLPALEQFTNFLRRHPTITRNAVLGFTALMTIMAALGSLLMFISTIRALALIGRLFGVFRFLGMIGPTLASVGSLLATLGAGIMEFLEILGLLFGAITLPAWGWIALIAAGLVALGVGIWQLWKHWDQVWPFLKNMGAQVGSALMGAAKAVGNFLTQIAQAIGKFITGIASTLQAHGINVGAIAGGVLGFLAGGIPGAVSGAVAGGMTRPHVAQMGGQNNAKSGNVYMDGRKVGEVVGEHIGRGLGAAPHGPSWFDPTEQLAYPGQGYTGG